jgi:MFS family permease
MIRLSPNHFAAWRASRTVDGMQVRAAFTVPGTARAFAAMLVGRLPMGAETLLMVLLINERSGSFARGGVVAAAFAITHAIAAPLFGRAIDRRGPVGVLVFCILVKSAALVGFALLGASTPFGVFIALAAVCGATFVPLSPVMRALWNAKLDAQRRHVALSLEAVAMEIVYIAGPLTFITLIGAWSLEAGLVACGVVTLAGGLAFVAAPAVRTWRPDPREHEHAAGALSGAGIRTLLLATALVGFSIPALEIAIAAFAENEGHTGATGLILGMWGLGSLVGGVVFGRRAAPEDPARRLTVLFAALAVGTAAPALATDVLTLGVLITISGFCIAPSFACLFGLVADVAPRGTIIEANTWITTGLGAGVAVGGAAGGWLVEHSGTTASFLAGAGVCALGALALVVFEATLRYDAEPAAATA